METYDVAVIGLGPVGLVAAALLAQDGLNVLAIDQTDRARTSPRVTSIDNEGVRLLQRLGLADAFLKDAMVAPPMQVVTDYANNGTADFLFGSRNHLHGSGGVGNFPQVETLSIDKFQRSSSFSFVFYQQRFDRLMLDHLNALQNVQVELNTELIELVEVDNEELVELGLKRSKGQWTQSKGKEYFFKATAEECVYRARARFVVGCDGSRSLVRKYLSQGEEYISMNYDEEWVVLDIMLNDDKLVGQKLAYYSHAVIRPERTILIIPCTRCYDQEKQGRHYRFDIQLVDSDPEDPESVEFVQSQLSGLLDPEDYELVRSAKYRFHCLLAPHWGTRRVFVAGDSAHVMPPFLGQGFNQGLKDVENICWKIAAVKQGHADPALLKTYEEERFDVARSVVAGALRVGKLCEELVTIRRTDGKEALLSWCRAKSKTGFDIIQLFALSKQKLEIRYAGPTTVNTGTLLPRFEIVSPLPQSDLSLAQYIKHLGFLVNSKGWDDAIEFWKSRLTKLKFSELVVLWLNPTVEEDVWIRSLGNGPVIPVQVKKITPRLVDHLLVVVRKDMRIVTTTERVGDVSAIFDNTTRTPWVRNANSSL